MVADLPTESLLLTISVVCVWHVSSPMIKHTCILVTLNKRIDIHNILEQLVSVKIQLFPVSMQSINNNTVSLRKNEKTVSQ